MVTVKKTRAAHKNASSKLVPAVPESSGVSVAKKRKRLAKVFSRPLDKKLREIEIVRVKFSLLADDYVQLAELKQRLVAQGSPVKKGELLRAGLSLLATLDDGQFKAALAKLQVIA